MRVSAYILSATVALTALSLAAVGAATAGVLPPNAELQGKPLASWARAYFAWEAAIPTNGPQKHPALASGNVDCSYAQNSKVWFLETGQDGGERRCSIPPGTALFVPVVYWVCDPDLDGVDFPTCIKQGQEKLPNVVSVLTVDGLATKTSRWLTDTGKFRLALAGESLWDTKTKKLGASTLFQAAGVGVLLTPLSTGLHTIRVSVDLDGAGSGKPQAISYKITVGPSKKG